MSYNKLYIQAFVDAMNARDFGRHMLDKANPNQAPITQGWSYGIQARYFDGRITTRRTSWVYARGTMEERLADPDSFIPAGAVAMVYFTTKEAPVGYLVLED